MKTCRLSPGEEAAVLQRRRGEKRIIRLLQVREQEQGLARSMCNNIRARKDQEQRVVEEQIRAVLARENQRELRNLENVYNSRVRQMGKGHREAHRITQERESEHQMRRLMEVEQRERAEARHDQAMKELTLNQQQERDKRSESRRNRKKAMDKEKERSRKVASRASSDDQPIILNFEAQKGQRIRFDEADSYASSYYHLPRSVVERDPVAAQCARDAARDLQEEDEELAKQTQSAKVEQDEKAWLRHKHALARVRLERDRDEMMSQLEILEKEDRARRQRTISGVPSNVFQPIHQRIQMVSEQQRDMEQTFERLLLRTNREMQPLASSMADSLPLVVGHSPLSATRESPRDSVGSRSPSPIPLPEDPVLPSTMVTSKQIQTEPQSVHLPRMRAEGLDRPSLSVTDTVSSMLSLSESTKEEGSGLAAAPPHRELNDTFSRHHRQSLPDYVPGDKLMQGGTVPPRHPPSSSSKILGQPLEAKESPSSRPPQHGPTASKPPRQPVKKPPNESMHRLLSLVREQQEAWKERRAKLGKVTSQSARVPSGQDPTTGHASREHLGLRSSVVEEYGSGDKTTSHQGRNTGTKKGAGLSTYPIVLRDSELAEHRRGITEISYDVSAVEGASQLGPTPPAPLIATGDNTLASQPLSTTQYHTTLDTSSDTRETSDSPDLVLRNPEKSGSLPFGRRSPKSLSITPYNSTLDNSSSSSVRSATSYPSHVDDHRTQLPVTTTPGHQVHLTEARDVGRYIPSQQNERGYSVDENLPKDLTMTSIAASGVSGVADHASFSSPKKVKDSLSESRDGRGSYQDRSDISFSVPPPMGQYMKSDYFRPNVRTLVPPSLDVTSSTLADEAMVDEDRHTGITSSDKQPHQPPISSSSPIRASPYSKSAAGQPHPTTLWHPLHSFHSSTCSPAAKGLEDTAGNKQGGRNLRSGQQLSQGQGWANHQSNQVEYHSLEQSVQVSESMLSSSRASSPEVQSDDDDDDDDAHPKEHSSVGGVLRGKGSLDAMESTQPQSSAAGSMPSYSIATSTVITLPGHQDHFPLQPSVALPHPLETSSTISEEDHAHHHTASGTQSDMYWQSSLTSPFTGLCQTSRSSQDNRLEHCPPDNEGDEITAHDTTSSSNQTDDEHDRTILSSVFSGLEFPDIALSYPTIRMPVQVGWFESGMSNSSREPSVSTCRDIGGARENSPADGTLPVVEGAVGKTTSTRYHSSSEEEEEELTRVSRLSNVSDQESEQQREEAGLNESEGFEYQPFSTQEQLDQNHGEPPETLQAAFVNRKADFVRQSQARMTNLRSSAQQRQQAAHMRTRVKPNEVSPKVPSKSPHDKIQSKVHKEVKFRETPVFLSGASAHFPEYETITREREAIKKREMKERNLKLYNRLDEVKQKKEEEERTKRYADNRRKAKDYHQRLRARSAKALSNKKKPKPLR